MTGTLSKVSCQSKKYSHTLCYTSTYIPRTYIHKTLFCVSWWQGLARNSLATPHYMHTHYSIHTHYSVHLQFTHGILCVNAYSKGLPSRTLSCVPRWQSLARNSLATPKCIHDHYCMYLHIFQGFTVTIVIVTFVTVSRWQGLRRNSLARPRHIHTQYSIYSHIF